MKKMESIYKNGKKQFGDIEIKKRKFHQNKKILSLDKYRYK